MYRIYHRPFDRLKQAFVHGKRQYYTPVWALKDISFDVENGEVFGIIGLNGAGKTTLLQVLAGILEPTGGQVEVHGRTLNLIELGSGMDYEETGRQNIVQYGLILGQTRKHIESHIGEAVAFADIGDFIDQPLKTYSAGMIMRVAFSVITICQPDILLVDEVISVGDMNFRMKCLNWLDAFIKNGGTVCMVSHDINLIANKCDRVAYLNNGMIRQIGDPFDVIQSFRYDVSPQESAERPTVHDSAGVSLKDADADAKIVSSARCSHIRQLQQSDAGRIPSDVPRKGTAKGRITKVLVNGQPLGSRIIVGHNEPIVMAMEAVFFEKFEHYSFGCLIGTSNGADIFALSSGLTQVEHPVMRPDTPVACSLTLHHALQPGEYFLQAGIADVPSKSTVELLDVLEVYATILVTGDTPTYGLVEFPYSIEFAT